MVVDWFVILCMCSVIRVGLCFQGFRAGVVVIMKTVVKCMLSALLCLLWPVQTEHHCSMSCLSVLVRCGMTSSHLSPIKVSHFTRFVALSLINISKPLCMPPLSLSLSQTHSSLSFCRMCLVCVFSHCIAH